MPEYKVTHAVFTYITTEGKRVNARRGEVIDVPKEIYEAHKEAFIPATAELKNPGLLVPLIDDPKDEHIEQYLLSGSAEEIVPQLANYTAEVKNKLLLAEQHGQARPGLIAALGGELEVAKSATNETPLTSPPLSEVPSAPGTVPVTTTTEPVTTLTDDSTPEEITSYLKSGKVETTLADAETAAWSPELRARVVESETAGAGRKGIVEGLSKPTE